MKKILIPLSFTLSLWATAAQIPERAEDITPLTVGDAAPNPALNTVEGTETTLTQLRDGKPTVVIFYRGGWCPYCRRHLAALGEIEETLVQNGWQLLALSPDQPSVLKEGIEEYEFSTRLISDQEMKAAKAFGIAFRVSDQLVETYKGYGIDLESASGREHQLLPVPAVFLVDKEGKIIFAHTNPDYKKRLSNADLLKAAGIETP